jgi:hypothetical protein
MMHTCNRWLGGLLVLALAAMPLMRPHPVAAASAAELNREAAAALESLYAKTPGAKELGAKAKGILVFPSIIKAGFIIGGQYGEGALREGGRLVWPSGRRADVRVRAVLHDRLCAEISRRERWLGDRHRPERRDRGRGHGSGDHDHDGQGRSLCILFQPEGVDGRARPAGVEDHQDRKITLVGGRAWGDYGAGRRRG